MRYRVIVLWVLFWSMTSSIAQVSIGIGLPGVSIGINLPSYPELVRVPNYPVYYAPRLHSNFFFYDGMYWVYQADNWYASSWYNGPWGLVAPEVVPLFVLRIPVRYYRDPPSYFRRWRSDAPPRWGEHWGNEWEQHRSGWDRWNRRSAPAPAPLPVYQRQYSGDRYPRVEQRQALRSQKYRYQPRDPVVRQHYQEQAVQRAPAPSQRRQHGAPQERSPRQSDIQRSNPPPPLQQGGPTVPRSQRGGEDVQRSAPTQDRPQQRGPAVQDQRRQPHREAAQPEKQMPRSGPENVQQAKGAPRERERGHAQEPERGHGQEKEQEKDRGKGQEKDRGQGEERGQGRNK